MFNADEYKKMIQAVLNAEWMLFKSHIAPGPKSDEYWQEINAGMTEICNKFKGTMVYEDARQMAMQFMEILSRMEKNTSKASDYYQKEGDES